MKRLSSVPGFVIQSKQTFSFNPFEESTEVRNSVNTIEEKPLFPPPPLAKVMNVLDSPNTSTEHTSFFKVVQAPKVVLEGVEPADTVPMIQPRDTTGQRLLYKYPKIPVVGPGSSYWMLVGQSDRSREAYLLQFDGAANPNPGPSSSGAVLWSPIELDGKRRVLFESGKFLGKATNNLAEVQGLLLGLKIAAIRGARELLIEGDSELIVFQQIGKYKVSDKKLKVWWSEIQAAMMDESSFDWIAIRQVPREQNERADSITKEVLQTKQSFQRSP
jgi:ribonuclease HI